MSYLVACAILVGLFALNVWLYRANQKTPVPEGCENLQPDCEACSMQGCPIRKVEREEDHADI